MFVAFLTVLILLSALVSGGQFQRLAEVRLRWTWLIIAALGVQVLITEIDLGVPKAVLIGLHLATYGAAGVAIWANRELPGLVVIGAGALLNGVTIALNDGTLPANQHALVTAGLADPTEAFANSGVVAHPVLPWFGDIMATPSWLPFRNVISIGDLLILVGAAILIHGVTRTVPARAVTRWVQSRRQVPAEVAV
jgi:hypothetical protein